MSGKLFIRTFGCQMNEYDSAKISGVLARAEGLTPTASAVNNAIAAQSSGGNVTIRSSTASSGATWSSLAPFSMMPRTMRRK